MKSEEAVRGALEVVSNAEVPADLREVAFREVLRSLLGNSNPGIDSKNLQISGELSPSSATHETPRHGDSPMEKIAERLKINLDTASHVYDATLDSIELVFPHPDCPIRSAQQLGKSRF